MRVGAFVGQYLPYAFFYFVQLGDVYFIAILPVAHQFGNAAHGGNDDRQTGAHRLDCGKAEGFDGFFLVGEVQHEGGAVVERHNVGLAGEYREIGTAKSTLRVAEISIYVFLHIVENQHKLILRQAKGQCGELVHPLVTFKRSEHQHRLPAKRRMGVGPDALHEIGIGRIGHDDGFL